jgi:hypothetical protein
VTGPRPPADPSRRQHRLRSSACRRVRAYGRQRRLGRTG